MPHRGVAVPYRQHGRYLQANYLFETRVFATDMEGVNLTAIALSGLEQATAQFERAAVQVAGGSGPSGGAGRDVVDLSAAAVGMLVARNDFGANIQVLKVADEMQRHTIDLLA